MWWKVILFCVLVCAVLLVVLSSTTGASAGMLFHRCCEDGIENDDVILEAFRHNFLRERLVMEKVEYVEEYGNIQDSTHKEYDSPEPVINSVAMSDTTHISSEERLENDEVFTPNIVNNSKRESDSNNIDISEVTHEENDDDSDTEQVRQVPSSDEVTTELDFDVKEEVNSSLNGRTFNVHNAKMRKLVFAQSESDEIVPK